MLWIKQIGDTPIPPQFEDESSVHVQAYVYLSDLFWSRSYFFITRVLINLFSGCQLCMGHAVDKDLSLVQQEVKGIIADMAGHDARLDAVKTKLEKDEVARREEIDKVLARLVSMEKMLSEEILRRVEGVEQGLAETNIKVEQLAHEIKSQRMEDVKPG